MYAWLAHAWRLPSCPCIAALEAPRAFYVQVLFYLPTHAIAIDSAPCVSAPIPPFRCRPSTTQAAPLGTESLKDLPPRACPPSRPGSALDKEAQERSTSVYLVDRVIPMLPRLLCEELCRCAGRAVLC